MRMLKLVIVIFIIALGALGVQMYIKNKNMPEGLGVTDGKLAPAPSSPNGVSSQTDNETKHVDPIPFKGSLEASKTAVLKALESYGGVEIVTNADCYIHAVAITPMMRFRDDLEFYFDESEKIIHFRSASRVGYGDGGLNRKRYNALVDLYNEK